MGGAASAPKRERVKRRAASKEDTVLLRRILASCERHSKQYASRIQDAANFTCEFAEDPNPSGPGSPDAENEHAGFANSKGAVELQTPAETEAAHNARRARQFADLMRWLSQNGAHMPHVSLRESGEAGFAVHCNSDIQEAQSIIKVPFSCLITDTLAASTPTGQTLASELRDKLAALAHCQLSVFLLEDMERGPKSPFHSYYASLPQRLPQHSLFWTREEKALLKGTCFLDDVQSFEVMVKTDYTSITARVPAFSRFPFEKFLWSRIIVSSRNFSIRISHTDHIAMVPLADMMNHHEPRRTAWEYRDEDKAFVVTSLDSFAKGSQITNSYGQKSASQLLLHYGFIPHQFGQNKVELIENQITMDLSPATTTAAAARSPNHRKEPPSQQQQQSRPSPRSSSPSSSHSNYHQHRPHHHHSLSNDSNDSLGSTGSSNSYASSSSSNSSSQYCRGSSPSDGRRGRKQAAHKDNQPVEQQQQEEQQQEQEVWDGPESRRWAPQPLLPSPPHNLWLKKKILGEPHVFRLRVNFSHRETNSCLRYLAVLAAASKTQLLQLKRMDKTNGGTPTLPVFFDLLHVVGACAIICDLARRRCRLLDAHAQPVKAIRNYNNLNAWRIAQIERTVALFFEALGETMGSIAALHEDLHRKLLGELQKRRDIMSQWVFHLLSCCMPIMDKLPINNASSDDHSDDLYETSSV